MGSAQRSLVEQETDVAKAQSAECLELLGEHGAR